jgi:hypothetical protein
MAGVHFDKNTLYYVEPDGQSVTCRVLEGILLWLTHKHAWLYQRRSISIWSHG